MRLTTKGQYAVSAMLDLASFQDKGPVTLAAISERQYISLSYLEQLFRRLRENGLVRSVRGPGGGYLLNRSAKEIFISEVITAVDEPIRTTLCIEGTRGCRNGSRCAAHELWTALGHHIYRFLDVVSLDDVQNKRVDVSSVELAPADGYGATNVQEVDDRIAAVS